MNNRRIPTVLVLFCLLITVFTLAGFGQNTSLPAGVTKITSVEGITEYRLLNGLQILLFPDKTTQNATVNIVYRVGSRHEGYGETGMAHLLEHLVFKGTPKYLNIPQEITKRGMSPNGTTFYDRTNYFANFPATGDNLEFYLDLEADRMVNSFIAKKDLDSEYSVVRNEMENGENNPNRVLSQSLMATAYIWHNYGKNTLGARSDVENVKIENLQAFYRKYYQPDNATLVVGGNFDEAKTLEIINKKFGVIPKPTRVLEPTWTTEPVQSGEREIIVRRSGDTQLVVSGYHTPPAANADIPALTVLERVLVDTPSGRLYKSLVETKKAISLISGSFQLKEPGFSLFGATLNKEQSIEEAQKALLETVETFSANPPTKEEVERHKLLILRVTENGFNDSNMFSFSITEWVARGDWRLYFLYRERLKKVTPEDVQRVAKKYLIPSNRTIGKFIPTANPVRVDIPRMTDEEITAIANEVKASETTATSEAFDSTPANIESRTKRSQIGGFKTAFLSKETRGDEAVARLSINFGDEKSLKNLSKVGAMTARLLMRGTTKRTQLQIKDALTQLKSSASIDGGATGAGATISGKGQNLPEVLKIVAEMLKEPAFAQSEFEQLKSEWLASLENERSEPQAITTRAMRIAYNNKQQGEIGYAGTLDEDIAEVKALTLESVKKFHKDFYGASNGEFVIVGEFDEKEVTPVVSQLFGSWKTPKPYQRIVQTFTETPVVTKTFETPDKANAFIFGRIPLKMRDDHPDVPALILGNWVFGGGFLNSRLATRIRQKDGISYGVGSGFSASPQDETGNIVMQAIFAPENLGKIETAFREEIQKVVTEGLTATEIAEAKQGWILGQQRSRATDASLRAVMSSYIANNRTFAWDDELAKKIQALTPEQVNAAMKKYLVLEKMSFFKAGDFAKTKK